ELDKSSDLAVLELGTSRPGEIARLTEIARPDVGVVTLVGLAHAEGLGSIESIAKEKASLLLGLHSGGRAAAYGDEPILRDILDRELDAVVYFGHSLSNFAVRLDSWTLDGLRTRCIFAPLGCLERMEIDLGLVGEAAALNAAAALAAVVALGASAQ